ncbi:MAG: GntR family transcriptional regulator [Rhodospirillaceae bacterium]|jgi:DNA-binding GntR family transcriptional regulator|nr:GntR family transcriptional regulator [Rhodospirillaceae bacterium]MBT5001302.1 GntR family transcriptional regulator [Tateyamaria sp.]MBT5302269.1 GntR family transcriptional regulator [Tateyamaria sp.]MBT6366875.1 GntR family transcriptional regulator [Bacteroidota bacterium]
MRDKNVPKLSHKAYESFTYHLSVRALKAGQMISQRELVSLTGLPLGAIRELIPRLEAEGLIRTIPQRGMSIAEVDPKLIKDAFEFRLFLEIQAVKYFTKHASDKVVGELLNETKKIIALCEVEGSSDITNSNLIADAQTVDWKLHEQIIKTLDNKIIIDAYRVNAIKIRLIKLEQTSITQANVISTMKEHLDIINAVQLRNSAEAEIKIVEHIKNARFRALSN